MAEDSMLRAYREWFEHARRCAGCKKERRCGGGQKLWDAYLRVRDGGDDAR